MPYTTEVKIEAPTAILDQEATLQLEVIAKDDRAEIYKGLGSVVNEATAPDLDPNFGFVP